MWKYVKFVLGIFLIFASVTGIVSVFSGEVEEVGKRIAENGVDTTGVIESRTEHFVAVRRGWIGGFGRYYTMKYAFTTLDGKKYSGEINITKDQAYSVRDGQQIRVRYYANQPSINAPLGFKKYMTARDAEDVPYGTMIFSALLMFLGGAWLTWSNWRRIRPARQPLSAAARMAAARGQPVAGSAPGPVARSGGNAMFGRR